MTKLPRRLTIEGLPADGDIEEFSRACLDDVLRRERHLRRASPDDLKRFGETCRHAHRAAAAAGPAAEARLYRLEAAALLRRGQQERSTELFDRATELFRWSAELFRQGARPLEAELAILGAAEAITRRAEMKQDSRRLRLALAFHRLHFRSEERLRNVGFKKDDLARSEYVRCIALMWLAEQVADTQSLTGILSTLKRWAGERSLLADTRRRIDLMLVATLTVRARQLAAAAAWRDVVSEADRVLPRPGSSLGKTGIHHYKARALHELGRIERAVEPVLESAEAYRRLAELFERHSLRGSAAASWHACGGALFTAFELSNDDALAAKAEDALETAQRFFSKNRNAQEWLRVQADLAETVGLRARRAGDQAGQRRAVDLFESALSALSAKASPVLLIRVARLLLHHQCACGWAQEALGTFGVMMEAQSVILDDPGSGPSVYRQLLREMREDFGLSAWALCKLGRALDATAMFDSGRARELAMKVRLLDDGPIEPGSAEALFRFESLAPLALPIEGARGGEYPVDPAESWAAVVGSKRATARRSALGLDPVELPEGTASVHVIACEFGSYAVVRVAGVSRAVSSIALQGSAWDAVMPVASRGPGARDGGRLNWDRRYRELMRDMDEGQFQRERLGADAVRCTPAYAAFNDFLLDALGMLWQAMMGPISEALEGSGVGPDVVVVVCLPAELLRLPVLAATSGTGVVFGHRWKAVVAPSMTIATRCVRLAKERAAVQSGKLLLISNTRAKPRQKGYMPFAAAEMSALKVLAAGSKVVHLSGRRASAAAVLRHMANCRILHASCHGRYDASAPMSSGLEIANDATVTIASIWHAPRLLRSARLCFLSACESGLMESNDLQDEFVGLPAGLIGAGASAVICTLWPIFDDTAMEVSVEFYRDLFALGNDWSAPEASMRSSLGRLRRLGWRDPVGQPSASGTGRRLSGIRARPEAAAAKTDEACDLDLVRDVRNCPYEWAGYVLFGA